MAWTNCSLDGVSMIAPRDIARRNWRQRASKEQGQRLRRWRRSWTASHVVSRLSYRTDVLDHRIEVYNGRAGAGMQSSGHHREGCIEFDHARFRLSSCEGTAKDGFEGRQGCGESSHMLLGSWAAAIITSGRCTTRGHMRAEGGVAACKEAQQQHAEGRPGQACEACSSGGSKDGFCPGALALEAQALRAPTPYSHAHTRFGLRSRVTGRTLGDGIRVLPVAARPTCDRASIHPLLRERAATGSSGRRTWMDALHAPHLAALAAVWCYQRRRPRLRSIRGLAGCCIYLRRRDCQAWHGTAWHRGWQSYGLTHHPGSSHVKPFGPCDCLAFWAPPAGLARLGCLRSRFELRDYPEAKLGALAPLGKRALSPASASRCTNDALLSPLLPLVAEFVVVQYFHSVRAAGRPPSRHLPRRVPVAWPLVASCCVRLSI